MGSEPSVSFGVELRRRRVERGLTVTDLSNLLFYSKGYLSRIEMGQKPPTREFAVRCDALLDAGGALVRLVDDPRPAALPSSLAEVTAVGDDWPDLAARPVETILGVERAVDSFTTQLTTLRQLGQSVSPSLVLPILVAACATLRELAARGQSGDLAILTARYAEYIGWMMQEAGDNAAALRWTMRAVELAQSAGDVDMVAYAFVRRANIALYQNDAFGTVELSQRAQTMECSARVAGLAAQREAQGQALLGNYDQFSRCIERSTELLAVAATDPPGGPTLGSTQMPDTTAFAVGWSLIELGRGSEAAIVLDRLFGRTAPYKIRAWARIGMRLALALADTRELEQATAVVGPILAVLPVIESATIRADLRRFARVVNRWHAKPVVRQLMPEVSAALQSVAPTTVAEWR